jgi:uncharacterized membrane protein
MQFLTHHIPWINVHPVERWLSAASGGILAATAFRGGRGAAARAVAGAMLIHRGLTGRCHLYQALGVRTAAPNPAVPLPYELGIRARAAVTVNQPRDAVYTFWRQLENLPRFMRHLVSVEMRDQNRSHWIAEGPAGKQVHWDAEIINEIPNELIAWRSLSGSQVDSAGSVRFSDAPGGRGTEIRVELQYNPPGGAAGAIVAKLFGREPEQEIRADLGRLKQFLESGQLATTEGQPQGSERPSRKPRESWDQDDVMA